MCLGEEVTPTLFVAGPHQMAEALTPNLLLSFPKGQSPTMSAAEQGRKM